MSLQVGDILRFNSTNCIYMIVKKRERTIGEITNDPRFMGNVWYMKLLKQGFDTFTSSFISSNYYDEISNGRFWLMYEERFVLGVDVEKINE